MSNIRLSTTLPALFACLLILSACSWNTNGDDSSDRTSDARSEKEDQTEMNALDADRMNRREMEHGPDLYTGSLDNGMDVLVIPDRRLDLAHIGVSARTGSAVETPELNGLMHLHEHMVMKGTEDHPSEQQVSRREQELGILSNASTSSEVMRAFYTLPSDNTAEGFSMLAGAIRRPLFKPEEVRQERNVVLDEYRTRTGDPQRKIYRAANRELFHKFPWRQDILGDLEIIKGATEEEMQTIQNRYYGPNNTAVIALGDVEPDQVLERAEQEFGDWERNPDVVDVRELEDHPALEDDRHVVVDDSSVNHSTLYVNQHAPAYHEDPDATRTADVWAGMLGLSGSKFQRNLVEKGPFSSASMSYYTQRDGPRIYFQGDYETGQLEQALDAFHREVQKFDDPAYFNETDLRDAVRNQIVNRRYSVENNREYLSTLGFWWAVTGTDYYVNYLPGLEYVTLEEVRSFCREHIQDRNRVYATLLPSSYRNEQEFSSSDLADSVDASREKISESDIEVGEQTEQEAQSFIDSHVFDVRPGERDVPGAKPGDRPREFEIAGGVPVILEPVTENDVVGIQLFFRGGSIEYQDYPAGIESFVLNAIQRGTESYGPDEIQRIIDREGIRITQDANYDYSRLQIHTPQESVPVALELVESMISEPTFPEDQVENLREQMMRQVQSQRANPRNHVWFVSNDVFLDGHPYHHYPAGTPESLQEITREDLQSYREELFTTGRSLISAVGNISPSYLKSELNEHVSVLQNEDYTPPEIPPYASGGNEINIEQDPRLGTHFIAGKFPVASMDDAEYPALEIGLGVLSDRIYRETRSRRGLTYGAYTGMAFYKRNWGYYLITTARPNLSIGLIYREMRRIQEENIGANELQRTATSLFTRRLVQQQTSVARAHHLGRAEIQGLGWKRLDDLVDRIRDVQPSEIRNALNEHLGPFSIGIIAGQQASEAPRKELFTDREAAIEYVEEYLRQQEQQEDSGGN